MQRALLLLAVLVACPGDEDTSDTDTSDTDTSDTGTSDTDTSEGPRDLCGACGGTCTPLPVGDGNLYCVTPYDPPMNACDGGEPSDCCDDAACGAGGECVAYSHGYCGGAAPPDTNVCHVPACATDADCGTGNACVPAGAFGATVATCLVAVCRSDADCTARAGGTCEALSTGSCGDVGGFYCTYADDPCRSDADCTGGSYPAVCVPGGSGTVCEERPPAP